MRFAGRLRPKSISRPSAHFCEARQSLLWDILGASRGSHSSTRRRSFLGHPERLLLVTGQKSRGVEKHTDMQQDLQHRRYLRPDGGDELSKEQREALRLAREGKNLFLTGLAGTGKSALIRRIIDQAIEETPSKMISVTSPTGAAAALAGGQTVHSWAGIGPGEECINYYLFRKAFSGKFLCCDMLIIDEISMIQPKLLDLIDQLAKKSCENSKPFGGIQIITCGDFHQLPPVDRYKGKTECHQCGKELSGPPLSPTDDRLRALPGYIHEHSVDPGRWRYCGHKIPGTPQRPGGDCGNLQNDTVKYAFQTRSWLEAEFNPVILKTVHRQTNVEWIHHLNRIAKGEPGIDGGSQTLDYLEGLTRPLKTLPNGVKPTMLYARRANVDFTNGKELARLPDIERTFCAVDLASCLEDLDCGKLLFGPVDVKSREMEYPEYARYLSYYQHLQCPPMLKLKVGAQVTLLVNKPALGLFNGSRGVVERFDYYRTLHPDMLPPEAILGRANVANSAAFFSKNIGTAVIANTGCIPIPVVRFATGNLLIPITPHTWEYDARLVNKYRLVLWRTQIPLALAWASTIHKSQGQTLDHVIVDITGCFSPGQGYAGLSRVKDPSNMQIIGGSRGQMQRACMAAPMVLKYYEGLERGGGALCMRPRRT